MTPLIRKLLGMNWLLVAMTLTLAILGVVAVYSASAFRTEDYWHKQALWVGVGMVVLGRWEGLVVEALGAVEDQEVHPE